MEHVWISHLRHRSPFSANVIPMLALLRRKVSQGQLKVKMDASERVRAVEECIGDYAFIENCVAVQGHHRME